jgi:hypothetical protein
MSILLDMLREEKKRAFAMKSAIQQEIRDLPKGYISRKVIRGKPAFYLQRREGGKVVGHYIPKEELEQVSKEVLRRRELRAIEKGIDENLKRIQKALKV